MNSNNIIELYTQFSKIYFNHLKQVFMSLTAKQAKEIATQYVMSGNELKELLNRIQKKAEDGFEFGEFYNVSESAQKELTALGYKIEPDHTTTCKKISWEINETLFDANKTWANKQLLDKEKAEQWKQYIWPESENEKNAKIQNEAWIKQEKQKAKYEAFQKALAIHSVSGYINPAGAACDELIETFGKIYELLISDL